MSRLLMLPNHTLDRPIDRRIALSEIRKEKDGNVMIEFALIAPILIVLIMNILDFSLLIWAHMQVDYSAQMGARAAYTTCSAGALPATTNCANLTTAVTTAAQATSLGSAVSLASGYPSETYYCVNVTTLQSVGNYSSPPSPFNCSAAGSAGTTPGDYIEVDVTYDFAPTFPGLSLASAQTLTGKAIQRLN
jgi:Flp pilus assembly protein TadG